MALREGYPMTVRKPLYALGLLGLTTLLTVGFASPAGAAQTCAPTPPATSCFTTSSDSVAVEQPVPGTTDEIETFKTRIVVQTSDGTTFDQSVDAPSDSPEAADATVAARAAAADDGLEVTGVETSPSTRTLTGSTSEEVTTPDRVEITTQTELSVGPATVMVGPDHSEKVEVPAGTTLINLNTRTTTYVNVATNTTNTYLTTATITITAVAPAGPTSSTTTTSTTVAPAVSPASTDTSSGELARTGTSTGPWTAAGFSLVLAGAACLYLSRRSAQRSST
jgi:hypothetical protein